MIEFTGERVVPGQVDLDLWNEHMARYAFACRLARGRRVADIGCGTGYGSYELARVARWVVGMDVATSAVQYAARNYQRPNLRFLTASAAAVPLRDGCVDLAVAFELIEHLADWRSLLQEAARLLARGGQFVVSTPNKLYYAESRKLSGPNPYHAHEFTFEEFRKELLRVFPYVSLYTQNHAECIAFRAVPDLEDTLDRGAPPAEVRLDGVAPQPDAAHFFVAVCALAPQTGSPSFLYAPSATNVLRERERHIELLESELATKDRWLEEARADLERLNAEAVKLNRELQEKAAWAAGLNLEIEQARQAIDRLNSELEERSAWASRIDADLEGARQRIVELQDELASEQARAREAIARLEAENLEKTRWAQRLDAELEACRAALEESHRTAELLHERLNLVKSSRWVRLGRKLGVGPDLEQA